MKRATPSATGMAKVNANSDTNTVTGNRLAIPKCIADVSVVTQLPP